MRELSIVLTQGSFISLLNDTNISTFQQNISNHAYMKNNDDRNTVSNSSNLYKNEIETDFMIALHAAQVAYLSLLYSLTRCGHPRDIKVKEGGMNGLGDVQGEGFSPFKNIDLTNCTLILIKVLCNEFYTSQSRSMAALIIQNIIHINNYENRNGNIIESLCMKIEPTIHKSFGIFGDEHPGLSQNAGRSQNPERSQNPGKARNPGVDSLKPLSAFENIISMIKLLRTPDSVRAGGALTGMAVR